MPVTGPKEEVPEVVTYPPFPVPKPVILKYALTCWPMFESLTVAENVGLGAEAFMYEPLAGAISVGVEGALLIVTVTGVQVPVPPGPVQVML